MKMELKSYLQICWLFVLVHSKPTPPFNDPLKEKYYCGSKLSDMIATLCEHHNGHVNVENFPQGSGGIVEECCEKPCNFLAASKYCEKLKPDHAWLEDINNSIIRQNNGQEETSTTATTKKPKTVSKKFNRGRCRRRKHRNRSNHNCRKIRGANHSSKHAFAKRKVRKCKSLCCKRNTKLIIKNAIQKKKYKEPIVGSDPVLNNDIVMNTPYSHSPIRSNEHSNFLEYQKLNH